MSRPRIGVIGSGFGAIGCAIELRTAGYTDITLWERSDEMGGVWRDNTYPGAGCDIPSPLYSFSFAPNPRWTRRYARQAEIKAYLEDTARTYGIDQLVRFGSEIVSADFDEATSRWRLTSVSGQTHEVEVLISAVGQLSRPARPDIAGLGGFAGPCFHSAEWDHTFDPAGRRVGVIGTGASAIQFVPTLVRDAASVVVFQRSAPYIAPKPDQAYHRLHRAMFKRFPRSLRFERWWIWALTELIALGMTDSKLVGALTERLCLAQLRHQVKDTALRARLRPDYPAGCKRILFSNDYLPALAQPHVEVVTERIAEVTADAVRTEDGSEHQLDAIVIGTGFAAQDFLAPMRVTGLGGVTLAKTWSGGAHAHLGMCVPGYPNLFLLYGPNTNTGSGSIIDILEAQARFVRQAVDHLVATGSERVEVQRAVAEDFDDELQERLRRSVWTRCASWYRHESGRISSNWPGRVSRYVRRVRDLDPDDFVWTGPSR